MRLLAASAVGWALLSTIGVAQPTDVVWSCDWAAGYAGPTTEYRHGVLGDDVEYKQLVIGNPTAAGKVDRAVTLPDGEVFEDVAPRCGDLTGDGVDEIVTVISSKSGGARLAVFDAAGNAMAETLPIGTRNRWLAPFAIGDLNGDGLNDIAYVDRPHLAGILRVWTLRDGALAEFARISGFSNHKIGQPFITGGIRDCGDGPELVLPNFNWSRLMSVTWSDEGLVHAPIGTGTGKKDLDAALACASRPERRGERG